MTVLLDRVFPRTLDTLLARLTAEPPAGAVEAWSFDDAPARRAAEARLVAAGIPASIRSAYKPLLSFLLEEVTLGALRAVTIRYPVHPQAHPERFLAETYPLVALLDGVSVSLEPGDETLIYDVELTGTDGATTRHRVFAPNRLHGDVLRTCGWLRVPGGPDAPLATEFEALFGAAVATVQSQDWSGPGPHFERLVLDVEVPVEDRDLGWGDEVVSLREAMHEDLFFTLRECLTGAANGSPADRDARPGQIVPNIRHGSGEVRLRISLAGFDQPATEPFRTTAALEAADRPLGMNQVRAALAALGHDAFQGQTRAGRTVPGMYRRGTGRPVLITAAQHANETTGVVGALRAAEALSRDPDSHFALVPVENVDGYELHQQLIGDNPRHMHHAARYTAYGDDVSLHTGEQVARVAALRRCGAALHINLHGYPAHEWTRPLTGYLPRGFELWSMPKGFFLIAVHHPGWSEPARTLIERVAAALATDAELVAFNRRQLAAHGAHAREQPFAILHDIPCFVSEANSYATPLTLITEAPDETIYGPAFVLQQTTQMRAVLAAVAAYATIELPVA